MDVKEEEPEKLGLPVCSDICQLCLSTERRMYGVESVSYAYGLITDWAPQRGARVCWECRAALVRLLRLKVQALRARELLDAAAHSLNTAQELSGRCMSQLSVSTATSLSVGDDCSPYPSDTECREEVEAWPTTEPYMVLKIDKLEIEEECIQEVLNSQEEQPPERPPPPEKQRTEQPHAKAEKTPKKRAVKAERQNKASKAKAKVPKVKSEGKGKRRTVMELKGILETFTVTLDELNAYRANALNTLRPAKFTCFTCVGYFKSKDNFKKHNAIRHSEMCGSFVCDICKCVFATSEKLDQHRSNHFLLFRCLHPSCGFVNHKKGTVREHHRRHVDKQNTGGHYECDYCGATFQFRSQMYRHIKMHEGRFLCETCGKGFRAISFLITHRLTHVSIDARPFPCTLCPSKFITKDKLAVHMLHHQGVKPFSCDECDRKFLAKSALNRHKMLRHSTEQRVQKRKITRTKSLFRNEKFFDEGRKNRTKNVGRPASIPKRPYQCNLCEKTFVKKAIFNSHKVFHTGERPHKCDECDLTFKYNSGLWGHKLLHKGVKAHQCTICGAQFTLKQNLNGHMKIHTKDKPYECDICGQRFPRKRNLRNHFKVHSK